MDNTLAGRKAVVTGAGKGIGRAIALAFAAAGADVCAISRTQDDVEKLSSEIRDSFDVKAIPIVADVSDTEDMDRAMNEAVAALGSVDLLVCAAGYPLIDDVWRKMTHELRDEDFLNTFQVDVLGSVRAVRGALPSMMKQHRGVIILLSSAPAVAGYNKGGAYTVAKAANLGLTKELASEYGEYNIRVYAIAPGNISTPRTFEQLSKEEQAKLALEASMRRWGRADEVADVAVALASERMSFVTGQTIVVDGGTVML